MQDLLRSGSVLFPGATEFIREAAAAVPIAIASGALRHEIDEIIEAAGIADLFSTIVAAGDTPQSKPSPAPYRLAFERLRESSGRAIDAATVGGDRGFALGARIGARAPGYAVSA